MSFRVICAIAALTLPLFSFSQVQMKLPPVTVADLEETAYALYPDTEAAILYDLGTSNTSETRVAISHHRIRRIKIYSKQGLDWANWSLGLYRTENRTETLRGFKASVYNLEKGKVTRQKLTKKDLIRERYNDDYDIVKLTFPNAKEGSILEMQYTIESDYLFEFGWKFQHTIPVKISEYGASVHDYYKFNFLMRNYFPYKKLGLAHWRMTDLPAFKTERFITSPNDMITQVRFDMTSAQFPGQSEPVFQIASWKDTKSLIRERWEQFKFEIKAIEAYMNSYFNDVEVSKEGAKQVFDRLRKDFMWDKTHSLLQSTSFRKIFDTKIGTSAELNLFLYEVLKEKGFKPEIHITSTLDNGRAKYDLPIISKFNHLLNRVEVEGEVLWLDLTSDQDAYNIPPTKLLGTDALEMNDADAPLWRKIETTKAEFERSAATIRLDIEEERIRVKYSLIAADYLKQDVMNRELEERLKLIGVDSGEGFEIDSLILKQGDDSLKPLTLSCEYSKPFEPVGDLIIINPLLIEQRISSPFRNDDERRYPIHFDHLVNTNYNATILIPEGYIVESLPESVNINLADNLGQFRYILVQSGNQVQVLLNYKINKTDVGPEVFPAFKEFYDKISAAVSEAIFFKKSN
jgi:hypothetical protein